MTQDLEFRRDYIVREYRVATSASYKLFDCI